MLVKIGTVIAVIAAAGWVYAQKSPDAQAAHIEGARELFYVAAKGKDPLPPMPRATNARADAPPPATPSAAAAHLGLRYNLALVNPDSGASREADPDQVLKDGDCFAIDFVSNRSGYLYVLAKQSSGEWLPLLPSPEMPDESNILEPDRKIRIPANYCFEIHQPAGAETLFVALSRDPRDTYQLYESIKKKKNDTRPSTPSQPPRQDLLRADAGEVSKAVAQMTAMFGTRDLVIKKVDQPVTSKEPAHAVYVVNASDRPSTSVAVTIVVKHR